MRLSLLVAIALLLPACGPQSEQTQAASGLSLSSAAFADGQPIPREFTCDGAGNPPPLQWSDAPPGTTSFALVMDDPDAPSGTFRHWGVYDLAGDARSISGGKPAINDFGRPGYGAPCPPKGHGHHHYRFKLYALDVDSLAVPANPRVADVESAAKDHVLAQGQITGTYERR